MTNSSRDDDEDMSCAGAMTREGLAREMRVLLVITSLQSGGAEKQFVALANSLAPSSEVTVMTMLKGEFWRSHLAESIVAVNLDMKRNRWALKNLKALAYARSIARNFKPDVVISFNDPPSVLVWLLQLTGLKFRHVVSDRSANLGSSGRIALRRLIYRKATSITANTVATSMALESASLLKTLPCEIVPNVVESTNYSCEGSLTPGFAWISVASLEPSKNHFNLLKAVALISQTRQDFRVSLVGGGPLEPEIRALTAELGVEAYVDFLGVRSDVIQLMCKSDALVLSSRREGLPNVLLEAAAIGLPAVSTDVGGVRDALPQRMGKFIVKSEDPEALANGMLAMMNLTEDTWRALGNEMRDHVKERFNQKTVNDSWARVLRLALEREPR
jgi:glycosyltransferase involved in cell wall biosynthesis